MIDIQGQELSLDNTYTCADVTDILLGTLWEVETDYVVKKEWATAYNENLRIEK